MLGKATENSSKVTVDEIRRADDVTPAPCLTSLSAGGCRLKKAAVSGSCPSSGTNGVKMCRCVY